MPNHLTIIKSAKFLTRWIATAALLRAGIADVPALLKPLDRLVVDNSIDATAAVECDGTVHDSR